MLVQVQTGQISAVERTDICLVSTHNVDGSEVSMFKSQIGGLALNHRKWLEMGLEWSPGPDNRPPGMPRPFPSLWDHSRGPKSAKKVQKLPVWGLALGSYRYLAKAWIMHARGSAHACSSSALPQRSKEKPPHHAVCPSHLLGLMR